MKNFQETFHFHRMRLHRIEQVVPDFILGIPREILVIRIIIGVVDEQSLELIQFYHIIND